MCRGLFLVGQVSIMSKLWAYPCYILSLVKTVPGNGEASIHLFPTPFPLCPNNIGSTSNHTIHLDVTLGKILLPRDQFLLFQSTRSTACSWAIWSSKSRYPVSIPKHAHTPTLSYPHTWLQLVISGPTGNASNEKKFSQPPVPTFLSCTPVTTETQQAFATSRNLHWPLSYMMWIECCHVLNHSLILWFGAKQGKRNKEESKEVKDKEASCQTNVQGWVPHQFFRCLFVRRWPGTLFVPVCFPTCVLLTKLYVQIIEKRTSKRLCHIISIQQMKVVSLWSDAQYRTPMRQSRAVVG